MTFTTKQLIELYNQLQEKEDQLGTALSLIGVDARRGFLDSIFDWLYETVGKENITDDEFDTLMNAFSENDEDTITQLLHE